MSFFYDQILHSHIFIILNFVSRRHQLDFNQAGTKILPHHRLLYFIHKTKSLFSMLSLDLESIDYYLLD